MAKIELPKKVRVGCYTFDIEEWPTEIATAADRLGECDRMNLVIRVRTDLKPQALAEVLQHEITHAAYWAGCCDSGDEEKVVSILARQFVQIWQDNPQVMEWIGKMARQK